MYQKWILGQYMDYWNSVYYNLSKCIVENSFWRICHNKWNGVKNRLRFKKSQMSSSKIRDKLVFLKLLEDEASKWKKLKKESLDAFVSFFLILLLRNDEIFPIFRVNSLWNTFMVKCDKISFVCPSLFFFAF